MDPRAAQQPIVYRGYIEIMEKKMETTIVYRVILG